MLNIVITDGRAHNTWVSKTTPRGEFPPNMLLYNSYCWSVVISAQRVPEPNPVIFLTPDSIQFWESSGSK